MAFTGIPHIGRSQSKAATITIGNGALRTCIGAEMQCATITDNGTGTLIAPRTHVSTAAVAVTNDVTEGFRPGDYWLQTVGPVLSVCSDNTDGAAVWTAL
jgi:exosome complex RNA-binding protein Csl4